MIHIALRQTVLLLERAVFDCDSHDVKQQWGEKLKSAAFTYIVLISLKHKELPILYFNEEIISKENKEMKSAIISSGPKLLQPSPLVSGTDKIIPTNNNLL